MSFDLYFYTAKDHSLSSEQIEKYLVAKGCFREGEFPQWLYSNEATGVYFSFEIQRESDDPEDIEIFESFEEFDNTRFSFNINFIRPNFFALEAFPFVERFMSELDLHVLNPQSQDDGDNPRKQNADAYYSDWTRANLSVSADHFDEFGLIHFPIEKSNDYWRYNFHKDEMQEKLGEEYFVPSLILTRQTTTGEPITLSTWTEHIPNVFPPADYFVVSRKRKKLLRTVDESGVISRNKLLNTFGDYLEAFDFKDCYIIHPNEAAKIGDLFNSVEFDYPWKGFAKPIELESLTNAERSPDQKVVEED
jgi:hypothetical protein